MSSELAIEVRGVEKRYQRFRSPLRQMWSLMWGSAGAEATDFYALRDVSFTLEKGQTLGIIGRNGAGKSTLLQILCGVLEPSAGSVRVQGRIAALLELGAGFNPEFTGRENVYLSAAVYGLGAAAINERMDSILAFAEIGDFIDQPVKTYSSGMFVRLAFAVIAHVDAQVLVIDEALAVGDFYFTQKCLRFLEAFAQTGTLIFVSHDTHSVVKLCDKAIWLEAGQVRGIGSAREISEAYLASFYENHLESGHPAETVEPEADGADTSEPEKGYRREFGLGGGRIRTVELLDVSGKPLRVVEQAQQVVLKVVCEARERIARPILGFYVKDRLGQPLFGENTTVAYPQWPAVEAGRRFEMQFTFELPLLATGEYSVTVALAEGTQQEHVQHHWIHDVLTFKSSANPHMTGLFQLQGLQCEVLEAR